MERVARDGGLDGSLVQHRDHQIKPVSITLLVWQYCEDWKYYGFRVMVPRVDAVEMSDVSKTSKYHFSNRRMEIGAVIATSIMGRVKDRD